MPTQQEIYEAGLLGLLAGLSNSTTTEDTMVSVDTHLRFAWSDTAPIQHRLMVTDEALNNRVREVGPERLLELREAMFALLRRHVAQQPPAEMSVEPTTTPTSEPEPTPEPTSVWDRLQEA